MAFLSNSTAIAVAVQSAAGTRAAINTTTDLMPISNLRPGNEVFTTTNPEYTGSVHTRGPIVLGRGATISFDIAMRAPGGTAPPAAGAFLMGRVLRAAGFTEVVQAAPLLASTALGAGSTTTAITLPAAASAVDDFYNGLPVLLPGIGAGIAGLSMIRDYTGATKSAAMMETFAAAPTGNVSIPAFLGYQLASSSPNVYLTVDYWLDQKRYKGHDMTVSALSFNFVTANRGDAQIPVMSVTLTGTINEADDEADEGAPTTPYLATPPVFRDGDAWFTGKAVCGASFTADMGITIGYPPCPGQPLGHEAPQITATQRSVTMNVNETLLTHIDWNALAQAQAYHGLWLQYGKTSGNVVSFGVPDGRLSYSAADPSGEFVTRAPELYIDGADKAFNLMFPYF